jgi:hypothetical protein
MQELKWDLLMGIIWFVGMTIAIFVAFLRL